MPADESKKRTCSLLWGCRCGFSLFSRLKAELFWVDSVRACTCAAGLKKGDANNPFGVGGMVVSSGFLTSYNLLFHKTQEEPSQVNGSFWKTYF